MRADFSSRLDHLSDEMCQMNTKIGRIDRRQSRFGGFAPPSLDPSEESSDGGDDKSDDASGSASDDKMTISQ